MRGSSILPYRFQLTAREDVASAREKRCTRSARSENHASEVDNGDPNASAVDVIVSWDCMALYRIVGIDNCIHGYVQNVYTYYCL